MNNHHERINKIREMAQSGEITYSDLQKKLTVAIEKEYQHEQPNIDFINACEDMLWEIGTQSHQHFVSVNSRYLEVIHNSTKPHNGRVLPLLPIKRLAIVFSVFIVIVCLYGGSIHWHWFFSGLSPDNEQYVIRGQSIDISLVVQCIAEHDHEEMFETDNWSVFTGFLGFEPEIINPSALGASSVKYYAYIESDAIHIDVNYVISESSNSVLLSIRSYIDIDEAYLAIEQETYGDQSVIDSYTVYTNSNYSRCSQTWIEGSTVYHISGQFSKEEGINMIQKFTKEKKHNE